MGPMQAPQACLSISHWEAAPGCSTRPPSPPGLSASPITAVKEEGSQARVGKCSETGRVERHRDRALSFGWQTEWTAAVHTERRRERLDPAGQLAPAPGGKIYTPLLPP